MMQRHMPIGYKMVDGKIHIDKMKEKVVKKIFNAYLSGVSTYGLAKELTAIGFMNANTKPSWNHGSIGKILENTKYLGDDLYPQMIEKEQFEQVQSRRKERCQTLGRTAQPNSMLNQYTFSGKIGCGECGEIYRKYVEHSGKNSERSNWKCKKYIYKNRVQCRCGVITDEQIKEAFISAANYIISKMYILDRKPKAASPPVNPEFKKLDQRVKEIESDGRYSSKELSGLIFTRAMAFYNTAEIKDYEHTTEKMKQVFSQREQLKEFDDNLFSTVVKHLTVYADRRLTFEFINGLTIDGTY
ncbi:recombinase [Listeria monocytogenes]|nr:recombinase [Listeria monocytogenes]EAE8422582.1 recombinase [Listeria monocytogenes]EAF8941945.1 recombinase [Listeria monocytogenes]EAF8947951.1 recombinase [Listeria monocytogenes]EAF8950555.1 recombinase [Listeria monocytogenes]